MTASLTLTNVGVGFGVAGRLTFFASGDGGDGAQSAILALSPQAGTGA